MYTGPALAGVSAQSNNPAVVGQGVFATASFATFKMRKDVELWEICFTMLQKVPKAYNKVPNISLYILTVPRDRKYFIIYSNISFNFVFCYLCLEFNLAISLLNL